MLIRRPFAFMRHGETTLNREGRVAGRTDCPLTTRGEAQARAAAAYLAGEWDVVATSCLVRARETASLAAPGYPHVALAGLNERDWGEFEGVPLARHPGYLDTPVGGESWMAFRIRVVDALNAVLGDYGRPLVVAHSGVFRVVCSVAYGSPDGERLGHAEPVMIEPVGTADWRIRSLTQGN
ncbi:histidine phosphatase family protein [Arhodomonas sp. AD133]|uniref:histidine phosphatase family protein n=1 Tax=Arhodomonas sp. AD133 TaxID=3415009 RepID=UPI003EC121F6